MNFVFDVEFAKPRLMVANEIKDSLGLRAYSEVIPPEELARAYNVDLSKKEHIDFMLGLIVKYGKKAGAGTQQVAEDIGRWAMLGAMFGTETYDRLFNPKCTGDVCEVTKDPVGMLNQAMGEGRGFGESRKIIVEQLETAFGKIDRGKILGAKDEGELLAAIANAYIGKGINVAKAAEKIAESIVKFTNYDTKTSVEALTKRFPAEISPLLLEAQFIFNRLDMMEGDKYAKDLTEKYAEYVDGMKERMVKEDEFASKLPLQDKRKRKKAS